MHDAIQDPGLHELTVHAEEARLEFMTKTILAALSVLAAVFALASLAGFWAGMVTREIPILITVIFLCYSVAWYACRRGYWQTGRYVPVAVLILVSVYGTVNGGGGTPLTLTYIVAIVLSAILLGTTAQIIVVLLSLASYITFSVLHQTGVLTQVRSDGAAFYNRLVMVVSAFLSLAVLLRFLIDQLRAQGGTILRARTTLLHSEVEYQILFNAIGEGVFITDLAGTIVNVNAAACIQTGYSREELVGRNIEEVSGAAGAHVAGMMERIRHERVIRHEAVHRRKDGSTYPVDLTLTYAEIGHAPRILAAVRDVTDRAAGEHALRESEHKYRTLFEEAGDAILLMEEETILDCNAQAEVLFGRSRDQLVHTSPVDLSPPGQPDGFPSADRARELITAAVGGQQQKFEWLHTRGDGSLFFAEVSLISLKAPPGRLLLAIVRDISAQKEAAAAMERARRSAEESSRAKSALLMNLSHEFRTPLTGILGLAEIISEQAEDEDLKRQVEGIATSGRRLLNTLESILKLAHLSSGEVEITRVPVSVPPVVDRVLEQFRPAAEEKGLMLSSDTGERPCVAMADEDALFAILSFLADNAVKFTSEGSVTIRVRAQDTDAAGRCCIEVCDTGIGIPADKLETVFEEFRQVSEGASRRFEGSGLGLTVAGRLASLLDGSLLVASTPGVGSTFSLWLHRADGASPASSPEGQQPDVSWERRTGPLDVLIVEDNFINKTVMVNALSPFCRTEHARNGSTAIRMARAKKYQAILMDINLGVPPDGIETTREIRRLPGYQTVPIIAVTGYTLPGEREQLLSQGLSMCLPKPFAQSELQAIVKRALR